MHGVRMCVQIYLQLLLSSWLVSLHCKLAPSLKQERKHMYIDEIAHAEMPACPANDDILTTGQLYSNEHTLTAHV